MTFRWSFLFGCAVIWAVTSFAAAEDRIEFNRDIRPILSDNCFACHGPDEKTREAGLRLDVAEHSQLKLPSGKTAIVPGKSGESELVRRVLSHDSSEQMPPKESGKCITGTQVELLKQWINQGAKYQSHWAFLPVVQPAIPRPGNKSWLRRNALDDFVQERLNQEQLQPSAEADRERLLRRLSFDLTGTPPTLDELDDFLVDTAPDAYEKVIDRLLASPRYGERMALDWLDAARYADTHGFNNDTTRYMWRWRDWTIDAFNCGMPFDQFVTEQLAGDLLPSPTVDQRIATGFNRNHVINSEGGIIPEEYRVEYVADRVHTTATILLGISLSCARCHDHKFDPFTQREYYQFFAFFNNLNEQGEAGRVGNAEPTIKAPTAAQASLQAKLASELSRLDVAIQERIASTVQSIPAWEARLRERLGQSGLVPVPSLHWPLDETGGSEVTERLDSSRKGQIVGKADWAAGKLGGAVRLDGNCHIEAGDLANFERTDRFSFGAWVNVASKDAATILSRMDDAGAHRGFDLLLVGGKLTAHLVHHWPDNALHVVTKSDVPVNEWKHVFATYDGSSTGEGLRLYVDGKLQDVEITNKHLSESTRTTKPLRIGRRTDGAPCRGLIDDVRIYDRELTADEVAAIAGTDGVRELLEVAADRRTPDQNAALAKAYLSQLDAEYQAWTASRSSIERQLAELEKSVPTAMVMLEMPQPRKAFVLKRGQYDQPETEVEPGTPASLPPFPSDAPRNRLGLAKWLLDSRNPLTSRVAVNRTWNLFFGAGLVETVEDFGSQGQWPTHLDLLNWLAAEFMHSGSLNSRSASSGTTENGGWDVKRLHRMIVSSATYRQSSKVSPDILERDPMNRLLARGPRFRLQAEMIRDSALATAGLLCERIGGPSVSPYQPAGLWDDVAVGADYEGTVYKQDKGEGLYRRSMYTFWKRTCPPPGLNAFDAPEREVCTARRSRTNTPLQALVLMNDPTYLEAARMLAERTLRFGGTTVDAKVVYAFRTALSRRPTPREAQVIEQLYRQRLAKLQNEPTAAKALLSVGDSSHDESVSEAELGAWASVMSVILNLDELITKG